MPRAQTLLALAVILGFSAISGATTIYGVTTYGTYNLSDLASGPGISVNGASFHDFSWDATAENGAIAPGSGIHVTAVSVATDAGTLYGLRFNGGWTAFANQVADTTIRFRMTAPDGHAFASDLLMMTAYGARGGGQAAISENAYRVNADGSVDMSGIGDGYVWRNAGYSSPEDLINFSPNSHDIQIIKDVVVSGGGLAGGSASISEFYQLFTVVPEPASISLLGFGVLAMRRRRK